MKLTLFNQNSPPQGVFEPHQETRIVNLIIEQSSRCLDKEFEMNRAQILVQLLRGSAAALPQYWKASGNCLPRVDHFLRQQR
jgi:CRISPR/Cas system-associated endonuclease Cas1